ARNWWLKTNGFNHDGSLPALCHQMINGKLTDTAKFQELANAANVNGTVTDLAAFAQQYIDVFARGYNYAFAVAAGAMLVSLTVYIFFNKLLPNKEVSTTEKEIKISGGFIKILISAAAMAATVLVFYF